jgi:hypothetical protein
MTLRVLPQHAHLRKAGPSRLLPERLFAQIKKSAPDKVPVLERLLSAGTLSQWLREHQQAGGHSMIQRSAKDVAKDGVPLMCAATKAYAAKNVNMRRGHLEYTNEKVAAEKRRRTSDGQSFSQADVLMVKRQAGLDFRTLSSEDNAQYGRQSGVPAEVQPQAACSWNLEGSVLWGVASEKSVVEASRVDDLIAEFVGCHAGASRYMEHFRAKFCKRVWVKDANQIPKARKLANKRPCHLKHPGLCQADFDRSGYKGILKLASQLHARAGEEGSWYQVFASSSADGDPEGYCGVLYCGFTQKSPRVRDVVVSIFSSPCLANRSTWSQAKPSCVNQCCCQAGL